MIVGYDITTFEHQNHKTLKQKDTNGTPSHQVALRSFDMEFHQGVQVSIQRKQSAEHHEIKLLLDLKHLQKPLNNATCIESHLHGIYLEHLVEKESHS